MYIYDEIFFNNMENSSKIAAEEMLPKIINRLKPRSVADFGCGEGVWLSVIKIIDPQISITGFDGYYIDEDKLKIPRESFVACDLSKQFDAVKCDLAMSIEVAEHIPSFDSDTFVRNITNCSNNILFSAAIPGQGGVHHINEQWQEYWIEKFESKGYTLDLSVRDYFWNNNKITPWRRQNILFFSRDNIKLFPDAQSVRSLAHPEMFLLKVRNIGNNIYYK